MAKVVVYSGTPQQRAAAANAEKSVDRRGMGWKAADVRAATGSKRRRARKAAPGTVFTSDPQAAAPTGYVPGTGGRA